MILFFKVGSKAVYLSRVYKNHSLQNFLLLISRDPGSFKNLIIKKKKHFKLNCEPVFYRPNRSLLLL